MAEVIKNKIQLKRGPGAPSKGLLDVGEPGYDLINKRLYIGNGLEADATAIPNEDYVATKIANINFPVVSVNDKTGEVHITPADIGAAPAGYGLGHIAYTLPEVTDANDAAYNGWYLLGKDAANGIGCRAVMRVDAYSSSNLIQTVFSNQYSNYYPLIQQRVCFNGTWGDWEWVNPPMVAGVEYRTTERWNGKPVYVRLVNYGTMPNNTQKSISISHTGVTQIVYAEGVARHSGGVTHVPLGDHTSVAIVTEIYTTNIALTLQASTDFSAWSAMVLLKYVK